MWTFQSIPGLNWLSQGIAFAERWKSAVCWKFQLISKKKIGRKEQDKKQVKKRAWMIKFLPFFNQF